MKTSATGGTTLDQNQRKRLQEYIVKIEKVSAEAEKLCDSLDDETYKPHLKAEVDGYRALIALWRKRTEKEA